MAVKVFGSNHCSVRVLCMVSGGDLAQYGDKRKLL